MTNQEIINHGYSYHDVLPRCTYEDTGIHDFRIEMNQFNQELGEDDTERAVDSEELICNGCGFEQTYFGGIERVGHLIVFYLRGVEIHRETLAHIDKTPQGKIADWLGIQRVVVC